MDTLLLPDSHPRTTDMKNSVHFVLPGGKPRPRSVGCRGWSCAPASYVKTEDLGDSAHQWMTVSTMATGERFPLALEGDVWKRLSNGSAIFRQL
jgi:hypothetical protein